MSDTDDKIRDAAAYDILTDRALRYKRNLFITTILALAVFYGEIKSDEITLSGLKFTLPNAEAFIPIIIAFILIYFLISFFRHANGEYTLWQKRIASRDKRYSTDWSSGTERNHGGAEIAYPIFNNDIMTLMSTPPANMEHTTDMSAVLYQEIWARVRHYRRYEYFLPLLLGTASLLFLVGKILAILIPSGG